jgi:hypothetical protein
MTLSVDLFFSFRSPYSYLALPKTRKMLADYDVTVRQRKGPRGFRPWGRADFRVRERAVLRTGPYRLADLAHARQRPDPPGWALTARRRSRTKPGSLRTNEATPWQMKPQRSPAMSQI